ncbi:MAG TPA: branched-chain amino acid ABC transporter permease [Gaiellaceae bacterium]|jgi:branched-chain amino acid transport system permease protein|nr:branched-chain amino acid ABC transporter permease [Gaiellaceae bacterium]
MTTTTGVYHTTYRADLALRHTRVEYVRLVLALAVVVALPFYVSPFWLHVLDQIGIAVIGAIGLNILVGYTGQISLGQGGFLAVGAYSAGVVATKSDLSPIVGVLVAVLVTAAVGAFFGLPALRLKGLYLAIATLASQQIIVWVITHWDFLTGGVDALVLEPATVFGWTPTGDFEWYWVIVSFAALATITATNLFRTSVGRAFVAIRDHDIAAEVIGVDPARYKVLAFAVSSAFVGLAGALTAYWTQILTWERFTLDVSILYLAMIIVGGLGSISGSIYGAAFMIAIPAYLDQLSLRVSADSILATDLPAIKLLIFGLTIVLFLIFEPRGLARIWQRARDYFRLWPFRY